MIKQHFKYNSIGNLNEKKPEIRFKIKQNKDSRKLRIIQQILVQSLEDEFKLQTGMPPQTPAKPDTTLT